MWVALVCLFMVSPILVLWLLTVGVIGSLSLRLLTLFLALFKANRSPEANAKTLMPESDHSEDLSAAFRSLHRSTCGKMTD